MHHRALQNEAPPRDAIRNRPISRPMRSNRHFKGVFKTPCMLTQFAVCHFPFPNFHVPPFLIDTSRN